MKLDEQQLLDNWNKLMECISTEFKDERHDGLVELYNHMQDRMMYAPASSKEHFHNCFIGGYVDHVLNVINCADQTYALWKSLGSDCEGYTREELIFAALNHDLGKVGDMEDRHIFLTQVSGIEKIKVLYIFPIQRFHSLWYQTEVYFY